MNEGPQATEFPESSPWHFLGPLRDTPEDFKLIELTRLEELRTVESMALASRASILYASSGNGKTSLIEAGLIPLLRKRNITTFKTRPRPPGGITDPSTAFKRAVLESVPHTRAARDDLLPTLERAASLLSADGSEANREARELLRAVHLRLGAVLQNSIQPDAERHALIPSLDKPIVEFMRDVRDLLQIKERVLVICDQFEELFVHYANTPEMTAFVKQLGELWAATDQKTDLLFSMREEWVGSMIELRTAIPDIFTHFYKLNPLSESRAKMVLAAPLASRQIEYSQALIDRITRDLTARYQEIQSQPFGDINLARAPKEDPYVEAPALQVIADALWNSRAEQARPFHEEHYDALGKEGTKSPADHILDSYVPELLKKGGGSEILLPAQWRDLRTECLYVMSDGRRHRRALSELDVVANVADKRRRRAGVPQVTDALVREALKPMLETRLVRRLGESQDAPQYELAHDFAVRSVVACYLEIEKERDRAETIDEERRSRLDESEKLTVRLLGVMPFVCYFLLLVTAGIVLEGGPSKISWLAGPGMVMTAMLGMGIAAGHRLTRTLSGVGLICLLGLFLLVEEPKSYVGLPNAMTMGEERTGTFFRRGDIDAFTFVAPERGSIPIYTAGTLDTYLQVYRREAGAHNRMVTEDDDGSGSGNASITLNVSAGEEFVVLVSPYTFASANSDYRFHIGRPGEQGSRRVGASPAPPPPPPPPLVESSRRVQAPPPVSKPMEQASPAQATRPELEPNDPDPRLFHGIRGLEPELEQFPPVVLAAIALLMLVGGARSHVTLATRTLRQDRLPRALSADVADIIFGFCTAVLASGMYGVLNLRTLAHEVPNFLVDEGLVWIIIGSFAMYQLIGLVAWRTGRTPGALWNGLYLRSERDGGVTLRRVVSRQFLFYWWALANVVMAFVPWFVMRWWISWKDPVDQRKFFDRWSGLQLTSAEGIAAERRAGPEATAAETHAGTASAWAAALFLSPAISLGIFWYQKQPVPPPPPPPPAPAAAPAPPPPPPPAPDRFEEKK